MLANIHVKNMALIKEADISLGKGLNILSGETGAGNPFCSARSPLPLVCRILRGLQGKMQIMHFRSLFL